MSNNLHIYKSLYDLYDKNFQSNDEFVKFVIDKMLLSGVTFKYKLNYLVNIYFLGSFL
jgi:hypothetical protein